MNNKIIIINGPNLNLLGEREQSQYGSTTFDQLKENCSKKGQGIEEVTRDIEATGDLSLMDKLQHELKMINKLGGLDNIVPSEGLTFTYTPDGESEPRIYKFTGIFAPVNQILGSLKFSR